jgi:hypothetical protein
VSVEFYVNSILPPEAREGGTYKEPTQTFDICIKGLIEMLNKGFSNIFGAHGGEKR